MAPQVNAERAGVVWGVVLAIALLGVLAFTMSKQETRAADAQVVLSEWFESARLPDDMVIAEASVMPRGDVAVRWTRAALEDESPRIVVEGEPKPFETFDWSSVPVGAADTFPREVLIAEISREHAADELRELFEGGMNLNGDWKSVPKSGAKRILERDRLAWGTFAAPYVIEREFENGGTFRDHLRVNLSSGPTPLFLAARWSRGFPASKVRIQELLAGLPPK